MSREDGTVAGVQKIVDNGPGSKRWDLVVLGDGYRMSELGRYEQRVRDVVDEMLAVPPFDSLRSAINVHRVNVASSQSGVTRSWGGVISRTYFDASVPYPEMERLIVANDTLALDVAFDSVPEANAVLLMVNTEQYGGSGGPVPVVADHVNP